MLRLLISTWIVLLISGCASKYTAQIMNINPGDTKATVISKLGTPENRQFNGEHEVFQYCTTGTSFGVSSYDVIWFYNGRVTGVSTYNVKDAGMCTSHFKQVKWEEAPDTVVEVRHR